MSWPRVVAARLRSLLIQNHLDRELDDEVRFHLEMQAEDNLTAGMNPAEARLSALRSFGGVELMKEEYRESRAFTTIGTIAQDLRYALRTMRSNPVFCLTAIVMLALGIGANTAIFTLLYGLLLRSLPVSEPSRLATIEIVVPAMGTQWGLERSMYLEIRNRQTSFSEMSGWTDNQVTMTDKDGTPKVYPAALVTGNGFHVLGVKPWLGRLLEASDDVRGGPRHGWTAVLSYAFWVEHFAGDPAVVGQQLRTTDGFLTIIGVTPPEFNSISSGLTPKLYLPYQMHAILDHDSRDLDYNCRTIARLRPGASLAEANAEMKVYQKQLFDLLPNELTRSPGFQGAYLQASSARAGLKWFVRQYQQPLFLMQALVGVVLLLCCLNVGGLMMARFYSRRREFAVRKAMGGSRWRLIRQYLLESSLIAVAGGVLGAAGSSFGSATLGKFFVDPRMPEPVRPDASPDMTVLLVTAGLAICAIILFGILPAWHAGRSDPGTLLKSRTAVGVRKQLAGRLFVPVQVALSLVLVVMAALLSQSMIRLRGENAGFDARVIIQRQYLYHKLPQKDDDSFLDVYQRIVDRLQGSPGIQSAAITAKLPGDQEDTISRFQAAGGDREGVLAYNHVGPGYFRTMQTRLLAGSDFERGKRVRSLCIVNESAAQYLFPHEPAIGRSVVSLSANPNRTATSSCRIIGIVENAKFVNLREPAPRTIYFPITKESIPVFGNFVFLIRSANEADAIAAYRKAAAEIVPAIPLERFATLEQQIDETLGRERLITMMSDFFGGLSLLLSAIGLYGLLSSSVTQRTAEMGVRLALGARRETVMWMILNDAVGLVSAGTLVGAAVLYMTVRFIQGMLYHISPFDPATLAGTAFLLLAVAFLAAWLPAFRASRVDPMVALRCE